MSNAFPAPIEVGIPTAPTSETFHRIDDARTRFGVSRSTWWRWIQNGFAPSPLRPSPGVTVWRSSDLDAFAAKLVANGGDQNATT